MSKEMHYNSKNMSTWKSKRFKKSRTGSQTPGKLKGVNCQATTLERFMAKRSRSYKHKDYQRWKAVKNGYTITSTIS